MIQTKQGNVLDVPTGIIVHGCNCHGVMGGGIAKSIKDKWPDVFHAYRARYETWGLGLRLGDVVAVAGQSNWSPEQSRLIDAASGQLPDKLIVVNAMTQFDFGRDPDVVYVNYRAVFRAFARVRILAKSTGLPVHFPLIGCGLANGNWDKVGPAIEAALGPDVEATLWEFKP
jgi:O-acetyl-ADP-ribose deacetylase (regulator of RNase III)